MEKLVEVYRTEEGRFIPIFRGKEITLLKMIDELYELVLQEQSYRESTVMRLRGAS